MKRRGFIAALGSVAAWPVLARAQQPVMPVIGFLHQGSPTDLAENSFRQGLIESGYPEAKNVGIEHRWANYHYDQLPALVTDLLNRQVAVIAAAFLPAAQAAKAATQTVPIIFLSGSDPLTTGLVNSLSRPIGNLTGVTFFNAITAPKHLELVRELVPKSAVIGVLVNPRNSNAGEQSKAAQAAAQVLGQQLVVVPVGDDRDIDAAFEALVQRQVGALLVTADIFLFNHREELIARATHYAIPLIAPAREFAVAGALMSYGASPSDGYRQQGVYVGKILAGAKPADLPVIQPTRFELIINKKTAKTLGLEVPMSVLMRVDEVIE
jgi:putative ABC transport system substrate-binding protein